MRPRPGPRDDALAVVATAGLAALLFPGALLRGESFFERDLHLDWYPRLEAIARALRAGGWPLWDPSVAFGQPLLADPGAQVAYPATWLALLAPRALAYTLFVVVHLALSAAGARRLGRAAGAGRGGAFAVALLWVLSGPLQSAVNLWHHFAGVCWAPWVLVATDRAVRRPGARSMLALAAAVALQVLAGSADACVMTGAFAAVWAATRRRRGASRPRTAAFLLGAAVLAAGLSAVVWRPAADLVSRSARRELPADVRAAWSVPPAGLLRLVAPLDPARVPYSTEGWTALYDRPAYPFLFSLYLGLGALGLGAAALLHRRHRGRAAVLGGVALAAVAFSLGPHGPLYPVATALAPYLRVFRYPSKAMLVAALAVALVGGLGVRALAGGTLARRRGLVLALALAAAAAGAVAGSLRYPGAVGAGPFPLLVLAASAVLALHALGRLRAPFAAAAFAALAGADLLAAHADLNATAPSSLVTAPPPVVGRVDREAGRRLYVYDYHSLPGTAERLLGRPDPYRHAAPPAGVDPRRFEVLALRMYLPPPSAGLYGIEGSYDIDIRGLYPRELNDLTLVLRRTEGTPAHARLLRAGAVGTVLSLHTRGLEDLRADGRLPALFPEPLRVWRVPGDPRRSWVVGCARVADEGEALRSLVEASFDPGDAVILPAAAGGASACGPVGTSRASFPRPDLARLEVDATAPGFVVLADSWDPGWRATLDGRPAPLLRANVAFRAVAVPAGRHVVEMRYLPRPVLEGALVSAASLLAWTLGALLARGRR